MNNTLTAKEWLEKEYKSEENVITIFGNLSYGLIERYASYRTRELEEKIMEYRNNLKRGSEISFAEAIYPEYTYSDMLKSFEKHFNITSETKD